MKGPKRTYTLVAFTGTVQSISWVYTPGPGGKNDGDRIYLATVTTSLGPIEMTFQKTDLVILPDHHEQTRYPY